MSWCLSIFERRPALFASAVVIFAALAGPAVVTSQEASPLRSFQLDGKQANDPIQVLGFRVAGQMVAPGEPFEASDDDWLQSSAMVVKNVSKREAVDIILFLYFPESATPSAPLVGDQLSTGSPPPEGMYSPTGEKLAYPAESSLSLGPGQTMEIRLGAHFGAYRKLLEQRKAVQELSLCRVRFVNVYFKDGMKWSPNYFAHPDPEHLGKYIRILPSEFYEYHPKGASN